MKAMSPRAHREGTMKALSPRAHREGTMKGCSRAAVLPVPGALCDMNRCYSRLRALVPGIPQDQSLSPVEILQHVIDYILDLQGALEAGDRDRGLDRGLGMQAELHSFSTDDDLCL